MLCVLGLLTFASAGQATTFAPQPGGCEKETGIARCILGKANVAARLGISKALGLSIIYQDAVPCAGPGLRPGQPSYAAASYLGDPQMRDLEARLHYRLRFVCGWGAETDPAKPPTTRYGGAVVVFTRVTKTRWVESVRVSCVTGSDTQHPCP